jgi:DNA polymerase III alpha subunit
MKMGGKKLLTGGKKIWRNRVAQIITFGTMAAKMAIRDVARVEKLPLSESDRLAKLVPERPGVTLKKAYEEVPELKKAKDQITIWWLERLNLPKHLKVLYVIPVCTPVEL